MFPGIDKNINPKKMQGIMKQLGIEVNELDEIYEVILKGKDEDIIIENPKVSLMKARGIENYQISGSSKRIIKSDISIEDIEFVIQNTGVNQEEAKSILIETNGDIAEAINKLKK